MNAVTHTQSEFAIEKIRSQFPALKTLVYGKPLAYLDNASSTQKPLRVIEAMNRFYTDEYSNVHRGVHYLSGQATDAYEGVRDKVVEFINAPSRSEIVFTKGTTESINLVAQAYGRSRFKPGDEILITCMEHHSNIVPWQLLCEQTGAVLRVAPIADSGELLLDKFEELLSEKTKLVAITHISNVLGTINPIERICKLTHAKGAVVLVDGAQAVPHMPVDVQALGCDFYAFSAHKMYGPTGVGILWGREELLSKMPPYQGGGDMIASVDFSGTTYADLPHKFEAGTPNIAGVAGFGASIDYLKAFDFESIGKHEHELLAYATAELQRIDDVEIYGNVANKASVISFTVKGIHPHDVGTILDREGVAVRAGHHCAQPLMKRLGVIGTVRASFALYNTFEEVDRLAAAIKKAVEVFA